MWLIHDQYLNSKKNGHISLREQPWKYDAESFCMNQLLWVSNPALSFGSGKVWAFNIPLKFTWLRHIWLHSNISMKHSRKVYSVIQRSWFCFRSCKSTCNRTTWTGCHVLCVSPTRLHYRHRPCFIVQWYHLQSATHVNSNNYRCKEHSVLWRGLL